jgi:hypothetical protein
MGGFVSVLDSQDTDGVGSEARASPEPGEAAVGTSAMRRRALLAMLAVGRCRTALSGCVSAPEGVTGHAGRRPPSHRLRRLCVWAASEGAAARAAVARRRGGRSARWAWDDVSVDSQRRSTGDGAYMRHNRCRCDVPRRSSARETTLVKDKRLVAGATALRECGPMAASIAAERPSFFLSSVRQLCCLGALGSEKCW